MIIAVTGFVIYRQHISGPIEPVEIPQTVIAEEMPTEPIQTTGDTLIKTVPENPEIPTSPVPAIAAKSELPIIETAAPEIDTASKPSANTAYRFEPKGVLSGLVTDMATGEPVTDAEISLSPGILVRVKTDEHGFYSIETIEQDGNFRIGLYSNEYIGFVDYDGRPKIHLKKSEQTVRHFQLRPACMIDVDVVDAEGNPIGSTNIRTAWLAEQHGREIGATYRARYTDENGRIRVGGFPPSDSPYIITATHYSKGRPVIRNGRKSIQRELDHAPGHLNVVLTEPNQIEYGRIVLRKGTDVEGFACYKDGTPAKECKIVALPDWWHCTTQPNSYAIDPNGLFTLSHILPGIYRIQASIPTGETSAISPTVLTTFLPLENNEMLEVIVPEKPSETARYRTATTDTKPKPSLYGLVTDDRTGTPIQAFQIRIQKVRGLHRNNYVQGSEWTHFDSDKGAFEMDTVGPGIYRVQVQADGYAPQWSPEINTDSNNAVLIKLSNGGTIAGKVVDTVGHPIPNATVIPLSIACDIKSGTNTVFATEDGAIVTDRDGTFVLKNIPTGKETLKVVHPAFTYTMSPDIAVIADKKTDIGTIFLRQGGRLEGFVYSANGQPQGGVVLYAQNHNGYSTAPIQYAAATTEPNGFYRMKNLPEELCFITRKNYYQQSGTGIRAVVPQNDRLTRLDLGGGPAVTGQVILNNTPLSLSQLTLTAGINSSTGFYLSYTDTDQDGRFSFHVDRPGRYTICRKYRGMLQEWIKLAEFDIDDESINLGVIPASGTTVSIQLETSDNKANPNVASLTLKANDPIFGTCVQFLENPPLSEMPWVTANLSPGLYFVTLRLEKSFMYTTSFEIDGKVPTATVTLQIPSATASLKGAIPNTISHLCLQNENGSVQSYLYDKAGDDTYSLDHLPPGRYTISSYYGYLPEKPVIVELTSNESKTFDLKPEWFESMARAILHVYPVDEHGYPIENTLVWIEKAGVRMDPVSNRITEQMFFIANGNYTIHAEKDGLNASKEFLFTHIGNIPSMEPREVFVQLKASD